MPKPNSRINEVDGIRGWAAFVVLLFHTFGEMLKYAVPAVQNAWYSPFLAGDIAVAIFFILSGDALSNSFFAGGGERAIDRLLVRRYLRLTVPIFMSCLLTYLIMLSGVDFHLAASEILHRPDWSGKFLLFHQSLIGLLRYSLIGVYISHTTELSYNPFLWTMSVEIIGSMLVFLLCYLWKRLKQPLTICLLLVIWFAAIGSYFSLFFAGMLMCYYRQQGCFDRLLQQRNYQLLAFFILALIVILLIATTGMHSSTVFLPFKFLVSMILVFCFYTQKLLKAFFSNKLSHFLGEISFPLYLVHFQVLISLMSWLVVQDFAAKGSIDQTAFLGFACIAVVVSVIAAWCFRQIERQLLKLADAFVLPILI